MLPVERRISDADREAAIARLQGSCADGRLTLDEFADRVGLTFAARTAGDLERVTGDLPVLSGGRPRREPTGRVISVFGGTRQSGRWRPARPTKAIAVFGSCLLDLTDAEVDGGEVEIRAIAVFGGIEVLVPEGVAAELTGLTIAGTKDFKVKAPSQPDQPVVRVHATTVFGGVTVRTPRFRRGLFTRPR
jgi:hypothetical protein